MSDDHFVPGLLFFPDLVAALRPFTKKPFHIHLMVEHPLPLIETFVNLGADIITIHYELGSIVSAALTRIRECGKAAGLALTLDSEPEGVLPYLEQLDLILIMGTAPGVKGCELSESAYQRIQRAKQLIYQRGFSQQVKIAADGGIRRHTVPLLRSIGADIIVPGSLVCKSDDIAATFRWLWSLPMP